MSVEDLKLPAKFNIEEMMRQAASRAAGADDAAMPAGDPGDEPDGVGAMEELSPLPMPGDPYLAWARTSNKSLPTLSLLKADGTVWSYPYACRVEGPHLLVADDAARSLVVVLRFSGLTGIEVTIAGRKLNRLVSYLAGHRVAWVRELPKGKLGQEDGIPVVTAILIKER